MPNLARFLLTTALLTYFLLGLYALAWGVGKVVLLLLAMLFMGVPQ